MTAKRVTWDERYAELVEHLGGGGAASAEGLATVVEEAEGEGAAAEASDGAEQMDTTADEGGEAAAGAAEGAASEEGAEETGEAEKMDTTTTAEGDEGSAAEKGAEETGEKMDATAVEEAAAGTEAEKPGESQEAPAEDADVPEAPKPSPPELAKDHPLAKWTAEQRSARRRSLLSQAKVDRLDSVGFDWGPRCRPSYKWHERIEQLRSYKAEHGDLDVPYGHPVLGTFVNNTRSQHRMNRLREERVTELTAMGFVFVTTRKSKGSGGGGAEGEAAADETAGGKTAGLEEGDGAAAAAVEGGDPPALPELKAPEDEGAAAPPSDAPAPSRRRTRTETVRLTVGAGSIGLSVDASSAGPSEGRGLAITGVSDGCSFRDHVSVGDRVLSVNGRDVVRPDDLDRDEDRDRELVFEVVREEVEEEAGTAAGDATMVDAEGEGSAMEVANV